MMHRERGFMMMLLGLSLFAAGCDDDSLDDERMLDRDDAAEGDIHEGATANELDRCARIDSAAECIAQLGCAPMLGTALLDDDDGGWCTDATLLFLGCASTIDTCSDPDCDDPCPAVETTLCEGDSYWRATGCVPDNLTVCEVPGELTGAC